MSDGDGARRDGRDRHEPFEWHEPTKLHGQDPKQSHAGNGTVNHGLDEQSPEGLESDELDLRRMLQEAVQEVEPRDGTLDYLRKAVPQRRTRKRQAVVGMAAAALFIGTAVPALVHVSNSTGSEANPSAIGHASEAQGGVSQGKGPDGGESTAGSSPGKTEGKDKGDRKPKDKEGKSPGASAGASQGAGPSSTAAAGIQACTAAQLGPAAGSSAAPDSTGAVYGSFRVTNVSAASCTVTDPGSVSALAQGAADVSKVGQARHTAGDAAAGLPDPSLEAAQLVLAPGAAYDVKFAWVPSETCPVPGGDPDPDPDPTPDPTPTEGSAAAGGTSTGGDTGTGTAPQLAREDGTVDGSVAVTYTPATGSGAGSVTVSNACAGTVYWTGVLAAS
ncbi:hypothetical protein GCM10010255_15860 [Streptomyces coeruleofuscus]|uniref:DUF4232 domain-containing protein n=1 Tax=Streptomyces coeruleofuscus TaxID=66879 RepID=A0ABP5UZ56_9ACTN